MGADVSQPGEAFFLWKPNITAQEVAVHTEEKAIAVDPGYAQFQSVLAAKPGSLSGAAVVQASEFAAKYPLTLAGRDFSEHSGFSLDSSDVSRYASVAIRDVGGAIAGYVSPQRLAADRAAAGVSVEGGNLSGPNAAEFASMSQNPYRTPDTSVPVRVPASMLEPFNALDPTQSAQRLSDIALKGAENRPGYYGLAGEGETPARAIGDTQTQTYQKTIGALGEGLALAGINVPGFRSEETRTGIALEFQRQQASDVRSSQYYNVELQKLVERPVERSAEYHYVGKLLGVPVPANPYEAQGDIAVEILKGAPTTGKEVFSPLSGVASYYTGGVGLQQMAYDTAVTGKVASVNYFPALGVFDYASRNMGPYGSLYGGTDYIGSPSSEGIRKQTDFVLTPELEFSARYATAVGGQPPKENIPALRAMGAVVPIATSTIFETPTKGSLSGLGVEIGGAPIPSSDRLIGHKVIAAVPETIKQLYPTPFKSTSSPPLSEFEQDIRAVALSTAKGYEGGILGRLAFGEKASDVIKGYGASVADFTLGVASLGLINKPFSKGVAQTEPSGKVYEYGEYSRFGEGAAKVMQESIGIKPGQIEAYQPIVEAKGTPIERVVYGVGSTVFTTPEKLPTALGGGAVLLVGGAAIGGTVEAAAAGSGTLASVAKTGTTIASYVLPVAFTGAMAYSVTEGFTASEARIETNVGKLFPEAAFALYGGSLAYGGIRVADRGGIGFGTRGVTESGIKPVLTLREIAERRSAGEYSSKDYTPIPPKELPRPEPAIGKVEFISEGYKPSALFERVTRPEDVQLKGEGLSYTTLPKILTALETTGKRIPSVEIVDLTNAKFVEPRLASEPPVSRTPPGIRPALPVVSEGFIPLELQPAKSVSAKTITPPRVSYATPLTMAPLKFEIPTVMDITTLKTPLEIRARTQYLSRLETMREGRLTGREMRQQAITRAKSRQEYLQRELQPQLPSVEGLADIKFQSTITPERQSLNLLRQELALRTEPVILERSQKSIITGSSRLTSVIPTVTSMESLSVVPSIVTRSENISKLTRSPIEETVPVSTKRETPYVPVRIPVITPTTKPETPYTPLIEPRPPTKPETPYTPPYNPPSGGPPSIPPPIPIIPIPPLFPLPGGGGYASGVKKRRGPTKEETFYIGPRGPMTAKLPKMPRRKKI